MFNAYTCWTHTHIHKVRTSRISASLPLRGASKPVSPPPPCQLALPTTSSWGRLMERAEARARDRALYANRVDRKHGSEMRILRFVTLSPSFHTHKSAGDPLADCVNVRLRVKHGRLTELAQWTARKTCDVDVTSKRRRRADHFRRFSSLASHRHHHCLSANEFSSLAADAAILRWTPLSCCLTSAVDCPLLSAYFVRLVRWSHLVAPDCLLFRYNFCFCHL